VDVERNLNTAVNKIREVLGDSAETPRFIETLSRRGYRFIAPVEPDASERDLSAGPIDSSERPRKHRRYFWPVVFGGVMLTVGVLAALWIGNTRPQGTPKVVRFIQLTRDGQRKIGPLVSDGVRIYFNEWLPDGRLIVAEASITGGEVIPVSVAVKAPFIQDLSKDGTELLVTNDEGSQGRSIWVQPVAGGSPHRVGTVLTSWGPWGPGLPDDSPWSCETSVRRRSMRWKCKCSDRSFLRRGYAGVGDRPVGAIWLVSSEPAPFAPGGLRVRVRTVMSSSCPKAWAASAMV
jgi:hypothetical protein